MKKRMIVFAASVCVLLSAAVVAVAVGLSSRPRVICIMQNPATGERVEMFKELWFKVPANYDEKKHIADWKAEQRGRGYTVEMSNGDSK